MRYLLAWRDAGLWGYRLGDGVANVFCPPVETGDRRQKPAPAGGNRRPPPVERARLSS